MYANEVTKGGETIVTSKVNRKLRRQNGFKNVCMMFKANVVMRENSVVVLATNRECPSRVTLCRINNI